MSDFDVVTGAGTPVLPEKVRAELAARQVPLSPQGQAPPPRGSHAPAVARMEEKKRVG